LAGLKLVDTALEFPTLLMANTNKNRRKNIDKLNTFSFK